MVLEIATLRSLLIKAWRERWTDVQWGIHIKTVLPTYISGDIYHLSDCLIQQAFMGSLPNNLILSYLKHSLSSQIVSHGGVINSISKFDGLHKPHCVNALLALLLSIMKSVSCRGKAEDCLTLALSLVSGTRWLVKVMTISTDRLLDLKTAPEHLANLNLAGSVLKEVLHSSFLMCMLHIGSKEDPALWTESSEQISQLEAKLLGDSSVIDYQEIICTLRNIRDRTMTNTLHGKVKFKAAKTPFSHAVHSLIMLELIMHTTRESKILAHQLLLIKEFLGMSLMETYLEILKSCFIGLSAKDYMQHQELKCIGLTYIKVPSIIATMHTLTYGESHTGPSEELCQAVKQISSMTTLLDMADYSIHCNSLEYLLKEFLAKGGQHSHGSLQENLLLEKDAQAILSKRIVESHILRNWQNDSLSSMSGQPELILRAQQPVYSILKTLSNKNTDAVLQFLSLLISGKSRELLLTAAASSGNLHIYAQKFVKLNEQSMVFNKDGQQVETSKMAAKRAVVFDISFLLLCHIAQVYGTDVVVSQSRDTFVEQWIQENIPECGKIKPVSRKVENVDSNTIEEFLRQINSHETENKYIHCNWGEASKLTATTLKEFLCASRVIPSLKKNILDFLNRLSYHICYLSISAAAWLCSHIQQVDGEEASQAVEFLTYMQNQLPNLEQSNTSLEYFNDRLNIICEIIQNMINVMKGSLHPPRAIASNSGVKEQQPWALESPTLLSELSAQVWRDISSSLGLLSHKALSLSQDLLRLGGTRWFVSSFVKSALDRMFEQEINRSVYIIFSLCHMDIIGCTITLLVDLLPSYINGPLSLDLKCAPRIPALARLTAMLMVSCWAAVQPTKRDGNSNPTPHSSLHPGSRGKKRSFLALELDDIRGRLGDHLQETSSDYAALGLGQEGCAFLAAVRALFHLMTQMTRSGAVSPATHFTMLLLKELVYLPHTNTILSLRHPLLNNLLQQFKHSPLTLSYDELLALTLRDPSSNALSTSYPADKASLTASSTKSSRQTSAKIICVKRCLELYGI